jgi:hypothetical protein
MAHPTEAIRIVGEIGAKTGIMNIGRGPSTFTGDEHRLSPLVAKTDAAFH